jgi:hypothetical protein
MSSVGANVTPVLGQDAKVIAGTAARAVEVKKPRKRVYKARVATKVKWALGDAMEGSRDAQRRMKKVLDWVEEARLVAEATADARMLALLGKLDHEIAGLALGVAEMDQILARAIAECKPQANDKKSYSAQQ